MASKQKKNKPVVVAVSSDHHVPSTVGLCPPYSQLDDGGYYKASDAQMWLWKNWAHFTDRAKYVAGLYKTKLISVFNGDMTEGNHHHTLQVVTNNRATQMQMAYEVIKDLVEASDKVYVIRGTAAHVGKSASLEEKIAEDISAERDELVGTHSWWRLPLEVNGTLFDFAHHGRLGRMPWTRINALGGIAVQAITEYHETGDKPPDVIIRSHLHQYADTGANYSRIRVIATPGWQLPTAFINQIAPTALGDIGGLIFTCWPGGRYEMELCRYLPERRGVIQI